MSKGTKRPLTQVEPIAQLIADRLRPYCERIEIAGSIRRRKRLVSDIELVVIPKFEERIVTPAGFFEPAKTTQVNLLWEYLDQLMAEEKIAHPASQAWGQAYRKFTLTTARGETHKVDVFTCAKENWGNTFLIRTGSAEFSQWMVTPRAKGGALPDGYRQLGGMMHLNGEVVPLYEEQDWFDLCGLPFVPPMERIKFGLGLMPSPTTAPIPAHGLPELALSIKQPWLFCITDGEKRVENRSWKPPASVMGQRIALHASAKHEEAWSYLEACKLTGRHIGEAEFARGAIVATAVVAGYVHVRDDGMIVEKVGDHSAVAAYDPTSDPWLVGKYGWILADVQKLPEPIPAKGSLNLWPTARIR